VINESKTQYMKINGTVTNLEQDLVINGQIFEGVQNFTYLGALINSKNLISVEIKSRIAGGNRCFYSLRQIFRSRATSKAVKIKIHKKMVKRVAVFGSEMWAKTKMDIKRLGTWKREILRRIHGPVVEQGIWRIKSTHILGELQEI